MGNILFEAGQPDANGRFTVQLSAKNVEFNGFQFVLRYDPNTVFPVANATGKETNKFSEFADNKCDWLTIIGTSIDSKLGLIDFTGYLSPGVAYAADRTEKMAYAHDNRTYVPIRFVAEALEMDVQWEKVAIWSSLRRTTRLGI